MKEPWTAHDTVAASAILPEWAMTTGSTSVKGGDQLCLGVTGHPVTMPELDSRQKLVPSWPEYIYHLCGIYVYTRLPKEYYYVFACIIPGSG